MNELVNVNISLDTQATIVSGLNDIIFISPHTYFKERVRKYSSLAAVLGDVPSGSDEAVAARAAFAPDIKPAVFTLGRREVDVTTITPVPVTSAGQIYSVTVTGSDGVAVTSTYTTVTSTNTAAEIATALFTGLSGLTGVTVEDNVGSITITKSTPTSSFSITALQRVTASFSTSETATSCLTAIRDVDKEPYFVTTSDHSDSFIFEMAQLCHSLDLQYWASTDDLAVIAAQTEVSSDIGSRLQRSSLDAVWLYHHKADTEFPEVAALAEAAPARAGTKVWGNKSVRGASDSSRGASGNYLTDTEKANILARDGNYLTPLGSLGNVFINGKCASSRWADEVRDVDFMINLTKSGLTDYLVRQDKIPYTDGGINAVRSVLESLYSRYISAEGAPSILDPELPFVITFPTRSEVAFSEITARTLSGKVVLYLTGAILTININGSATYNAEI